VSNHPRFTVSRVKIGDGPAEFEVQDGGRPLPWGEGVHPTREAAPRPPAPGVPLRLNCPVCDIPHFDEGEWATRPHRTHLCGGCGTKWTPAAYPTVGA